MSFFDDDFTISENEFPAIAARMKSARKALGLSQQQVADQLGISRPHISNIENGNDNPSKTLLFLFCFKFDIDSSWLIRGEGYMQPALGLRKRKNLDIRYEESKKILDDLVSELSDENDITELIKAFSSFVKICTAQEVPEENRKKFRSLFTRSIFFLDVSLDIASTIRLSWERANKEGTEWELEELSSEATACENDLQEIFSNLKTMVQFDTSIVLEQKSSVCCNKNP